MKHYIFTESELIDTIVNYFEWDNLAGMHKITQSG